MDTAAKQEAALLTQELAALDEHTAHARRVLDGPLMPADVYRRMTQQTHDLTAAVVERSRRLARMLAP